MVNAPLLLSGLPVAKEWHAQLLPLSHFFYQQQGRAPGLAVIRIGSDPASLIYVNTKRRKALSLGIHFEEHHLPFLKDSSVLYRLIEKLNAASHLDGLILQLPFKIDNPDALSESLDPLNMIAAEKDVDGLHPLNRGALYSQSEALFVPCTPLGCLKLLEGYNLSVEGREVVVMGRSILVGRPLSALLLRENATVTMVHSYTQNLETITKRADFLFVAIGRPSHVNAAFVKQGAVVIDIGIHAGGKAFSQSVQGDTDRSSLESAHLKAFSPVPGGVGPLTVMGLMHNTLKAAFKQCTLSFPL